MKAPDIFYLQPDEPVKVTLLALKEVILSCDIEIKDEWKYGMPFFCYRKKCSAIGGFKKNSNSHTWELWKENILTNLFLYRKNVQE